MEGATAKLRCELSKVAPVEWRKGPETLRARDRVSLRQDGAVCELEIRGLTVEDAGEYSCVCGQERTSATLAVRGKDRERPQGPVASCLRGSLCHWLHCRILCLFESFPLGPCRCLLAPGSSFSRCQCPVLCDRCSLRDICLPHHLCVSLLVRTVVFCSLWGFVSWRELP